MSGAGFEPNIHSCSWCAVWYITRQTKSSDPDYLFHCPLQIDISVFQA